MKFYTGSYTEHVGGDLAGNGVGIQCFNLDDQSGEITPLTSSATINPGYLCINQSKQLLYSFQERLETKLPLLLCFNIEGNKPELLYKQEITGGLPCHILHIKDYNCIVVSCYETGNFLIYDLGENGIPQSNPQNITYAGNSINKERQEGPHAHMAHFDSKHKQLLLADLGCDKVYCLKMENKGFKQVNSVDILKGGGPRHMVQHPNGEYIFVNNEMTAEISLLKWETDKWKWIKNVSAISPPHLNHASASAIKISTCGAYIYVGLRSSNSISTLKFDAENETLLLIEETDTRGITPRDFELSPDGKVLIVGNQDSESIVCFGIDVHKGTLNYRSQINGIASVCCMKFE